MDRAGTPEFHKPNTLPGSCSPWLQINPVDLTVAPGETQEVRYTLDVPANAQGTYRTILMFETATTPGAGGSRPVNVRGRVGSVLYVQVGTLAKRARVKEFHVTPEKTRVTVENTGTSHLRLKGTLQFRNAKDEIVQQVPTPGAVILPGGEALRDLIIDTPKLPSGPYTVTLLLDYGGEVLLGARARVQLP
jgi:hypothetical protein